MYFDFDFNRDNDFFDESPTFKMVKEKIEQDKRISDSNIDKKIVNASIRLWSECVIKNNLDINSHRVDHLNLLSEQNSKEVFNVIGKIIWKSKDKRTPKEFELLREQGIINNLLQLHMLYLIDEKVDICSNLKTEFKTWKLAQELNQEIPINEKKIKNKKL